MIGITEALLQLQLTGQSLLISLLISLGVSSTLDLLISLCVMYRTALHHTLRDLSLSLCHTLLYITAYKDLIQSLL